MNQIALGIVSCLVVALPAQQLAFARNDNASMGGYQVGLGWPDAVVAYRFTATLPTVAAAQVFTGGRPTGACTVELRTRNPVTGLPDQLVSNGGTWMSIRTRCFQGAAFNQPANLTLGQDYFLVWRTAATGYSPYLLGTSAATEPSNVPVELRIGTGSQWITQQVLPAKFRLFAPYPAGTTSSYGTGGGLAVPTIGLSGWPARGSPIDVWLDDAPLNELAVLVVGTPIPSGLALGFADLWVTPDQLLTFTTQIQGASLVGGVSLSLFVPNTAAAVGYPLSFQWGVIDHFANVSYSSAVTGLVQ